jgi:hypothetical protein
MAGLRRGFRAGHVQLEEATIASTQKAIQDGKITCRGVVQAYIDRIKAYNGTCTALVTADGKPLKPAKGIVRGGRPLSFQRRRSRASTFLPDLTSYQGRRSSTDAWSPQCRTRPCNSSSACASAFPTRGSSMQSRR